MSLRDVPLRSGEGPLWALALHTAASQPSVLFCFKSTLGCVLAWQLPLHFLRNATHAVRTFQSLYVALFCERHLLSSQPLYGDGTAVNNSMNPFNLLLFCTTNFAGSGSMCILLALLLCRYTQVAWGGFTAICTQCKNMALVSDAADPNYILCPLPSRSVPGGGGRFRGSWDANYPCPPPPPKGPPANS